MGKSSAGEVEYLPVLLSGSPCVGCSRCEGSESAVTAWWFGEAGAWDMADCLCFLSGGGSEREWGSWGVLVGKRWGGRVEGLCMSVIDVQGCSGSCGL